MTPPAPGSGMHCHRKLRTLVTVVEQQNGQTLIEYAISLGVLLTAIFTLIELCLVF
jgi:glutamine synthetase